MATWIWICIAIDAAGGLALLFAMQRQDAAGSAMVLLPTLLLFAAAGVGFWLLKSNKLGGALTVSAIPAAIVVLVLLFTATEHLPRKKRD